MIVKERYYGTLYSFETDNYSNVIRVYLHSTTQTEFELNLTAMEIKFTRLLDK